MTLRRTRDGGLSLPFLFRRAARSHAPPEHCHRAFESEKERGHGQGTRIMRRYPLDGPSEDGPQADGTDQPHCDPCHDGEDPIFGQIAARLDDPRRW